MAINESQKVDWLWKKLGYGVAKTDIGSVKAATNESIASPLLIRGDSIWQDAATIPTSKPSSSTLVVEIYDDSGNGTATIETIADSTATPNRTWKTNLIDWVSSEFGSTYQVKVYLDNAGAANPQTTGTQLFAAGSGNNDEWFFDYQAGVLNFIGNNLPGNISGKKIYIVGARYIGNKGGSLSSANIGNLTFNVNTIGVSNSGGDIILDPDGTGKLTVLADNVTISGDGAITIPVGTTAERPIPNAQGMIRYNTTDSTFEGFDGANWGSLGGVKDVDQNTYIIAETSPGANNNELDFYTDGSNRMQIGATGNLAFGDNLTEFTIDSTTGNVYTAGNLQIAGNLQVDGTVTIINSTTVTIDDPIFTLGGDTTPVTDDNKDRGIEFKWYDGLAASARVGFFGFDDSSGKFTFIPNATNTNEVFSGTAGDIVFGEATLASAIVSDLTDNRIVIAGTAGALEDDANFTFNGTELAVGVTNFTVQHATGNTDIAGTLDVTGDSTLSVLGAGETTLSSATISDLTAGRVVLAGTDGAIEDSTNLTFDGTTLTVTGSFASTVEATLASAIVSDLTAGRVVLAGTAGAIEDSTNLTFDGTDLTASSAVISDLTDNRIVIAGTAGALEDDVNLTFDGTDFNVTASVNITGDLDVDNININANTITSTDLNGNVNITPAGTGEVVASTLTVSDLTDNRLVLSGASGALEDSANLTYDGSTFDILTSVNITGDLDVDNININGNTVISTDTNGNINLTPNGVGEVVIATATVSDLTDNRIVIAGTAGALEDDANFTFDGTTFDVGQGDFTVDVATGNTFVNGTFETQGLATLNTAVVENLTNNRIVIAGATSNLEDDANLTFDGTDLNATASVNITGDLDVDNININGNTIISTDTNGNINITPNGAGEVIASTLTVSDLTDNRIVIAGTAGSLEDDANFTFNGTELAIGLTNFTVQQATGDTLIAGTLGAGETTLSSATISDLTAGRVVLAGTAGAIEDSANLTFDGTTLTVTGSFASTVEATLASAIVSDLTSGRVVLAGTAGAIGDSANLTFNGTDLTAASAIISDLTDNRIVIAGTAGAVEDDANFTFDGTELAIGLTNFTVQQATGNVYTAGSLETDSEATLASAIIEDLTNNRIIIAGTGGAVEDDANFTFDGTTFEVGTAFDVTVATGNTLIGGTLGAGETTLASATVSDLTATRLVIAGTAGALEDSANITFDGTTLTVTGSFASTVEATLASAIVSDLTSGRVVLAGTSGAIEDSANFTFNGTTMAITAAVDVTGDLDVDNININGNTVISTNLNGNINITPAGTGEVVMSTASVSDLTSGRVVLAGTSGAIEDDANFTFNGTELAIGLTNFTVQQATGNIYTAGSLETDSEATLASAIIEDLTNNRVLIAGTGGAVEDDANFTFDGTTLTLLANSNTTGAVNITGDLDVDNININANSITSTDLNGNISITPAGSGEVIVSTLTVSDLTANRVVLAGTAGAIEDNLKLTFDDYSSTFTVTGNIQVLTGEATLNSAIVSDLTDNRIVIAGTAGALEDDANFRFNGNDFMIGASGSETFKVTVSNGNVYTAGNLQISGNLQVDGTTTTVNSATVTIDDPVFTLGGDTAPTIDDNLDRGIEFRYFNTTAKIGFFGFDDSSSKFTFIPDATNTGEVFSGNVGDAVFGNMDLGSATINSIQLGVTASNEIDTTAGNLVLDSTGGTVEIDDDATISGTLGVTGETTLSSAIVSDLTDNRIVITGTAGAIEDDANLTFNGTELAVGVTNFTVQQATGNVYTAGTLHTDSEATLASAIIEDLTNNRVLIAGTGGAVEDDANFTFDGTTLAVTGAATISTTLGVTGETTLASAIISDLTATRVVLAGTSGAVEDSANLTFNGTTLAVTGATTISTTLGVTGETTLASAIISDLTATRVVLAGTSGAVEDSANFTFDGTTLAVTGATTISTTLGVTGEATLASATVSDLTATRVTFAGTAGSLEDSANFTFDGTTLALTGAATISTTLGVTGTTTLGVLGAGETTLSSATISDLTTGRVILAGTAGAVEDSANLTFDGTTLTLVADQNVTGAVNITGDLDVDNININGNTVISTDTNGNINLTPNGAGEVIASTLTVSDLTDNRLVISGAAGSIEDDANLTFNGTTFVVGVTNFTVQHATGNIYTAGTLGVTGEATLASAIVSDLTAGRVVYVGTNGALVDNSNMAFDGTTLTLLANSNTTGAVNITGDLDVDNININANTITSTDLNGNINITPAGAGEVVISTAAVSDLTDNRIVIAGTAGALEDDANFTFDGTTLTLVANSITTGSVDITGDLDVDNININANTITSTDLNGNVNITPAGTGEVVISTAAVSDLTDNRIVIVGTSGALEDDANFTFDGTELAVGVTNFTVQHATGNTDIAGTLTVGTAVSTTTIGSILDEDDMVSDSNTALATQQSIKAYIDSSVSDVDLTFTDGAANGTVNLITQSFTIAGTSNEIETSAANQTITIGLPSDVTIGNDLIITNDLTVNGDIVTLNTASLLIEDPIITIGGTSALGSDTNLDKGIEFNWHNGATSKVGFFGYDDSANTFTFIPDATNTLEVISGAAGDVVFGEGTFTGITASNIQVGITTDNTINTTSGALTIDSADGTVTVDDNLTVTGEATLASAIIEDLTNNRIIIAGPSSELEDDANFRFDGTTFMLGASGSEVFTVAVATGNTNINGTLNVQEDTDLGGSVTLGASAADNIIINGVFASNLIPDATDTRDIGSSLNSWRDLYLTESINFKGATSENEIIVPTNLADSLSIKDSTGDLIVINTTTGLQKITITPALEISTSFKIGNTVTVTGMLDEDDMVSDSNTALATQQSIKAYVDNQNSTQDLNFAGDSGTGTVLIDSETFTIAGTSNEIETSAANQTITIGLPSDVTVSNDLTVGNDLIVTGDLTVSGTTTYVNTTELNIGDNIITLNADLPGISAPTENSGIEINRGSSTNVSLIWDETVDKWTVGAETIVAGTFEGSIDGGTF